jgi:hypothetical protein
MIIERRHLPLGKVHGASPDRKYAAIGKMITDGCIFVGIL